MSVVGNAVDNEMDLQIKKEINSSFSSNPLVLRLQELLITYSKSIETEDNQRTEIAVSSLLEFMNYIHDAIVSSLEDTEASKQNAMGVLTELLHFISSPSLDQMVVDALSFELPKLVVKFAGVSDKFCEISECIIDRLISTCSPRDMLSIICEALDSSTEIFKEPAYYTPLLSGLSKVFLSIQRRPFEHIKEAMPAILNVLQAVSSELDDENKDSFKDLIGRAINIATSIQEICQKLDGRQKEQICALLGLYVLQIMTLASSTLVDRDLSSPMMSQLSQFLPFCNLSYLGLITGDHVEAFTRIIRGGSFNSTSGGDEENDGYMSCFSLVNHGAFIAVVWGFISDEVAKAAEEDLAIVKDNLQKSQTKRWQAVGMLKYVLSSTDQPWQLKEQSIDFVLCIMEGGNISQKCSEENSDCLFYIPSLFSAVQAIEMVIIYASNAVLRKKAFAALKLVLADVPAHQRFDIFKALINNCNYPSMIAILIDLVRENLLKGLPRNDEIILDNNKVCPSSPFWSANVLELVEMILKPPEGGPPSLPEQSDAVLSALNLYRFLLITESSGKTNYTGVLSKNTLEKAYKEWLLPLRNLVTGTTAENEKDHSQFAVDTICALNPLQLVLYRCIELIEDKLQHTA